MFNAARHHDEFAFIQPHGLVAKLDAEAALHYQEPFVFVLVVMPDKFALELVELHQLAIQFTGNVGLPVFGYAGNFSARLILSSMASSRDIDQSHHVFIVPLAGDSPFRQYSLNLREIIRGQINIEGADVFF